MSLINRHPSEEIELRSFNLPVARTLERFLCDVKKMSDEFFRGDLFGTDWTRATRWNPAVDNVISYLGTVDAGLRQRQ